MELRLLLALLLTVPILFIGPYFFGSQTPPSKKAPAPSAANSAANPAERSAPVAPAPAQAPLKTADVKTAAALRTAVATATGTAAGATQQQPLPSLVVQTNLFRISLSNQGATVRSWQLKGAKYRDNDGKQVELVNSAAGIAPPFSFYLPGDKDLEQKLNWSYYAQTADADGLGVTYRFSDGHVAAKKVFRFQRNSYLSQISTEILVDGKPLPHMIEWRGGFGDLTVPSPSSNQHTVHYDLSAGKLTEQSATAASKGPIPEGGTYSFAGITDAYFAAVFLPSREDATREIVFTDTVPTTSEAKPMALSGIAISDGDANQFRSVCGS